MDYDTALITGAQVVTYTGVQDLANLESDGEFDLDAHVLEGHRWLYRHLESIGLDPSKLTNQDRLKSAEAYATLQRLALSGHVDPLQDRERSVALFSEQVERELRAYRPETSEDQAPATAMDGIPCVGNFDPGWVFADEPESSTTTDRWSDVVPESS